MKKLFFLLLTGFLASAPALAAPLPVVASFSVLADMVRQVGGEAVAVKSLVGVNADVHAYQPTPEDSKAIANAALIFENGLGLEGWMSRLVEASGTKGKVVIASTGITPREMKEEDKTVTDPHAWQDLSEGKIYVKNIAGALEAALPDQAQAIAARAKTYEDEISKTDSWVKKQLGTVPQEKRIIITQHDAFGYFGAAYGVKFLAPEGVSTESAPSAAAYAKLSDQMKKTGAKSVFFETATSPRTIQQLAHDTGAQVGGALYADTLSAPDGPAPTYLGMFKNNVPKMAAAMSAK